MAIPGAESRNEAIRNHNGQRLIRAGALREALHAGGFEELFEGFEVGFEGAAAGVGEGIPGDGFAVEEFFFDGEVAGVLEFAELGAEVAVGFLEEFAEAGEGHGVDGGEEYEGAQAGAVLEEGIELVEVGGLASGGVHGDSEERRDGGGVKLFQAHLKFAADRTKM